MLSDTDRGAPMRPLFAFMWFLAGGIPACAESLEVIDADGDGIVAAFDCDDNDANMPREDFDCDGVLTVDDCNDADPSLPMFDDFDCDGVLVVDDCNDADATMPADDADCDAVRAADDCNDADPLTGPCGFVRIEAGTFTMGSPTNEAGRSDDETRYTVTLTHGFYLQATEVTQADWEHLMETSPSYFGSCGGDCPVERVSWYDALAYADALNRSEGLEECYSITGESVRVLSPSESPLDCTGYRLPTEAEWEYAARAGTTGARYGSLDDVAWYGDNADRRTHPVGEKQANAWGLYDMLGNVNEWVWDRFNDYPVGATTDPLGGVSSVRRVIRGGSWYNSARYVRAADRGTVTPDLRYDFVGFRLSRSLP